MPIDKDIRERLSSQAGNARANESNSSGYYDKDLRRSKFEVNVLRYPSDLGSENLLHYVEFGINVRGKSKFNKENRLFETKRDTDAANLSEEQLSEVTSSAAKIAGAAIGFKISKDIAALAKKGGSVSPNPSARLAATPAGQAAIIGTGTLLGAGVGSAVINANNLLKPDTSYRISDVVALYVDGPPTVNYSMNYANKDLGTLAGIFQGGILESLGALNPMSEKGAAAVAAFAKLPGVFGAIDVQSTLSTLTKTSLNPFKEVVFESVDFRSFAFKYKFMPKSKQESETVHNIIKLFKFHMHPELSQQKLFFIYPSEFQITYYFGDKENNYFHKFAPCVLSSMDVSYGGDQFSSFDDGSPSEINVSLTFRETSILTKDMIEKGY